MNELNYCMASIKQHNLVGPYSRLGRCRYFEDAVMGWSAIKSHEMEGLDGLAINDFLVSFLQIICSRARHMTEGEA